ncbi:MAG TPA: tetratricopeptide repeat protein, partial [Acidobacteriota bacterium]|nr:tetratricopeptide repeat protein [Acidobacteriota bacterium]
MLSCLYRQVCLLCIGFLVLDGSPHQALVHRAFPPNQIGTILSEQDPTQLAIEKLLGEAEQLLQSGKYDQALPLAQQAVEESEKNLGSAHPLLATSLNLLAEIYRSKGEYVQAEPLYLRSLKIKEKVFGADHLEVATSL